MDLQKQDNDGITLLWLSLPSVCNRSTAVGG